MDLLIEIILELLFEGGAEICANRKISKWIRYPILFVFFTIVFIIVFGLIFLGILELKTNLPAGLVFLVIGLIMLVCIVLKFRKQYIEKIKEKKEEKER